MAVKDFEPAQLDDMIAQCADALRTELEAERAALAKSSHDDPGLQSAGSAGPSDPPEASPEGSASGSGSGSIGSPEGSASAGAPDLAASPEAAPAPAESAAPAPDAGAIEPAPTVEALQAEYMKLPPDQKKLHYLAAKAALLADMGAAQGDGMGAGSPPPAPPMATPSAPPMATPSAPPMQMGEMGAGKKLPNSPGNGGARLGKSESELLAEAETEVLRKQLAVQDAELKAQTNAVEKLTKAVEKLTTPIRKSIKSVSDIKFIPRTEEGRDDGNKPELAKMTKSEIQNKLKEAIRGGKLTQADKSKISEFNVGAVGVDKIQHLLVDAK